MAMGLTIEQMPELRSPALICGFSGWTDAGEAASAAVRWLVRRLPGKRFASIDAEGYHNFTSTRPTARLVGGERRITWPVHDFFFHADPQQPRDLVLLVAKEPELRWRSYSEAVIELARRTDVTTIVTMGAFLGDSMHNRPVPLSGFATTPELLERLDLAGAMTSNYEGPTGLASTLLDSARRAEIPAVSLWAAVPHYLPSTPNPKAALALVRGIARVINLDLDLHRLEAAAAFFQRQVEEAIANDRRATGYVRELERRAAADPSAPPADEPAAQLPSAEDVIRDLEAFLRAAKRDDDGDG
jgi:predicted ATP-grasp superfamily ATP-dependent carboligase